MTAGWSTPTRPISIWPGRPEATSARSSACSPARRKSPRPIYRLAQAAREHRTGAEEIRLSPSLDGAAGIRLVSGARPRPAAQRHRRRRSGPSRTSPTSASGRRTSSRNCSTRSIISITRRPASCRSIRYGAIVYLNATLAAWLDYDLAQVGSGGLESCRRGAAQRGRR